MSTPLSSHFKNGHEKNIEMLINENNDIKDDNLHNYVKAIHKSETSLAAKNSFSKHAKCVNL